MAAGDPPRAHRLGEWVGTIPINIPKTSESQEHIETGTKTKGQMATKSKQARMHLLTLDQLPDVPLDNILSYLTPEDLRRFHQVSKSWKHIIELRPRVQSRRVDLVKQIRQNKENIPKGNVPLDSLTPVSKRSEGANLLCSDGKPGGRQLLGHLTNPKISPANNVCKTVLQTPATRFLQEVEAGKRLIKGQQLFRCPECRSPVPSPISSISKGSRKTRTATIISDVDASSIHINQDSGYQSTNSISTDIPDSEEDQCANNDVSSDCDENENDFHEEISMSVIATPEVQESSRKGRERNAYIVTPRLLEIATNNIEKMRVQSAFNDSSSHTPELTPRTPASYPDPDIAQCPSCSHRFCCSCQSTAHPGRSCYQIDSEVLSTPLSNYSLLDSTQGKSKQKTAKKALRRLARL